MLFRNNPLIPNVNFCWHQCGYFPFECQLKNNSMNSSMAACTIPTIRNTSYRYWVTFLESEFTVFCRSEGILAAMFATGAGKQKLRAQVFIVYCENQGFAFKNFVLFSLFVCLISKTETAAYSFLQTKLFESSKRQCDFSIINSVMRGLSANVQSSNWRLFVAIQIQYFF